MANLTYSCFFMDDACISLADPFQYCGIYLCFTGDGSDSHNGLDQTPSKHHLCCAWYSSCPWTLQSIYIRVLRCLLWTVHILSMVPSWKCVLLNFTYTSGSIVQMGHTIVLVMFGFSVAAGLLIIYDSFYFQSLQMFVGSKAVTFSEFLGTVLWSPASLVQVQLKVRDFQLPINSLG